MQSRLLFSLFMFFATPLAVLADDTATLSSLVDEFLAGASINDPAMHKRFWSEDLVYTGSAGARYGKAKILEGLSEPSSDEGGAVVYTADQMQIKMLGAEAAVVTFRLVATAAGGDVSYFFNTGVFQREESQWRASVWQATRVPAAAK